MSIVAVVAVRPAPPRTSPAETTTTIGLPSPRRDGGRRGRERRHPAALTMTSNVAAGDAVRPGSTDVGAKMMRRPVVHLLAAPSTPTIDQIAVSLSHLLAAPSTPKIDPIPVSLSHRSFTRSLIYVESRLLDGGIVRIATLSHFSNPFYWRVTTKCHEKK